MAHPLTLNALCHMLTMLMFKLSTQIMVATFRRFKLIEIATYAALGSLKKL